MPKMNRDPQIRGRKPWVEPRTQTSTTSEAIQTLYAVERQAGAAVQESILTTWIACATYFVAAATLITGAPDDWEWLRNSVVGYSVIPLPALALASYHFTLFATAMAHAQSIVILEERMVSMAGWAIKDVHENTQSSICARSETQITEGKISPVSTAILSALAYGIPYISLIALEAICIGKIWIAVDSSTCARALCTALVAGITLTAVAAGVSLYWKVHKAYTTA